MSISSDWNVFVFASKTVVEKSKEANSFFLTCSLQLLSCPLPPYNTHSRHKDTLSSSDCERGSLSLNVSGKWRIWSHLPESYWNAAVVGQLFKTPEIHRPKGALPSVWHSNCSCTGYVLYVCVCVYIIFFTKNILWWKKKLSLPSLPRILSLPLSFFGWKKVSIKRTQLSPRRRTRSHHKGKRCPWSLWYLEYSSQSLWSWFGHFSVGTGEGVHMWAKLKGMRKKKRTLKMFVYH